MSLVFRRFLSFFRLPTQSIWILVGLVSWTVPLGNYVWLGDRYFSDWRIFLIASANSYTVCTILLALQTAIIQRITKQYPELSQTPLRMVLEFPVFFVLTIATSVASYVVYRFIPFFDFEASSTSQIIIFWIGAGSNIISLCIYELYYTLTKWRENSIATETYKQQALLNQLNVLKTQVNPHFLFNSLNSLIALIGENPQQAERFAEELSVVYRYILRANEQDLTQLDSELDFIHAYAHLLNTRYGSAFRLVTQINPQYNTYKIPSLTLQLLVENAVKHNVVMSKKPLTVEIRTDEGANLHVINNLQRKKQGILSNGVGLTNIVTKYQMLGQPPPTIREEAGLFRVALPLIPA
ncbi:sensor histidine kinase [Spirosoma pulveris]